MNKPFHWLDSGVEMSPGMHWDFVYVAERTAAFERLWIRDDSRRFIVQGIVIGYVDMMVHPLPADLFHSFPGNIDSAAELAIAISDGQVEPRLFPPMRTILRAGQNVRIRVTSSRPGRFRGAIELRFMEPIPASRGVLLFQKHLDTCEQCRTQPFDLCPVGVVVLQVGGDMAAAELAKRNKTD